jgi:hypothetical protein
LVAVFHDTVGQVAVVMLVVVGTVTAIGVVWLIKERDVPVAEELSVSS